MKKITTLITAVGLLSFMAALSARANLIWYEGFQYPNGSLAVTTNIFLTTDATTNSVSGGLWLRPAPFNGSANPDDAYVVNSNLQVTATGGTKVSRQDDPIRYFATTNGTPTNSLIATYSDTNYDFPQVLYASFTVICSTTISNGAGLPTGGNGTYFASFYSNTNYGHDGGGLATTNANGYGYFGRVQAFTNGTFLPNTWRLGVTDNSASTNAAAVTGGFPIDLAVDTAYHVVEELDPTPSGLQAATIWINPINIYQTGSSPAEQHYTASDGMGKALVYGVNAYAFRQASSFGNAAFLITNLAVATTFAEAATNVCPTNAIPPVIVYQPVGVSNFVGSSISLSAVANGQGLGNMTYQWQLNGTNFNGGGGGNANILTISPASTNESGNYTLIATTPWGLSATSSVATVLISAGTNPPAFLTEPVNQTVYKGQTVIFSTTVVSPGNLSYQWKSNSVDIVGANSSTLELDNVTTNSAAAYSVGVTNDVNPRGVVSTNGVLTVLNPPVVTIAYLRSLQNVSAGYVPTAPLTQPFQVTGTITTFTNLTTGNTASYYLQDGTAGINIFATGGSTFRPAQGAVVTYVGVLSSFGTGLELYADTADSQYPYTSYVDTGNTAPLPAPRIIPMNFVSAYGLDYVNTNLGGSLVELNDVYFGARGGTPISSSGNDIIAVTNSLGQTCNVEFYFLDNDTTNQTLPSYAYAVTGVMYGFNTTWAVGVTRFADIAASPVPIPLTATAAGGNVTFNWGIPSYSLQSSTNVSGPYTTIPGAASGFITNTASAPMMFFRLYHP